MSTYVSGFGNEFATEAIPGALPAGQNSPQHTPLGLFAEQLSGTPFTAPRAENRRSWLYRKRPSADHRAYHRVESQALRSGPFTDAPPTPNRLRWDPLPYQETPADVLDGLTTICGNGDPALHVGIAIHQYVANRSMQRAFFDADAELLLVPQDGGLDIMTEFGRLTVVPGEIAVIPRGVRMRIALLGERARGYACENYGALLRLPELGPIGSNGLANARDFLTPVAAFDETSAPTEIVQKFGGALWSTQLDRSPFDVVAWHGNYAPYKYDLARFQVVNSVSYDHNDPSIFTVLTSPSHTPGTANLDFVIFPPRWSVSEHTFRPPWFHRNVMNEYMGLITGEYDAKAGGFVPGGASLHNCMSAHGPDVASYRQAVDSQLVPQKIADSLAFMFETAYVLVPTAFALATPALQPDYDGCWNGF